MAAIYIAVSSYLFRSQPRPGPAHPWIPGSIKCPELAHLVRVRGVKEILVKMEE